MFLKTDIQIMSGAKAIIETLKKLSVDRIFGYPGGIVLDLYDELYKQNDIKHILVRHEQFAVHAAEGYARESGKCGVVLVTSGPGATNTITGINNAYLDGFPLIVLAGQVSNEFSGKNAYQEVNICEMTKKCTKAAFQITNASDIEQTLINAYQIATEGKKGPVVVDLVKDIFSQETEYSGNICVKPFQIVNSYVNDDVIAMNDVILQSKRPVIVAGGGIHHSKAYDELEVFADFYKIPVVYSMMGAGAYKKTYNNLGMIGINGDVVANELIKNSDLIISFGCRFNDRITSAFKKCELSSKTIIIDLEFNKSCKMFLKGDINSILKELNNLKNPNDRDKFFQWLAQTQDYRKLNNSNEKLSNMQHGFEVLRKIDEFTKGRNVVFTSDVGQHQVSAVKNITTDRNRRIYVSGGFGTMGFGLPAAIGCAIANPEAEIVCITGDGSLQMSLSELALCRDLGLNIKVVILNNGYLGMVRQLQQKNYAGRYSQTKISSPDFVKLAQSYGLEGLKVNCSSEIEMALNKAFSQKSTFILDFEIESMEIV